MFQFEPTMVDSLPDIYEKTNVNRLQGISIGNKMVSVVSDSYRLFKDEEVILGLEEALLSAGITDIKQHHHVMSTPLTKNIYYYKSRGRRVDMRGPNVKIHKSIIVENSYNRESAYKIYAGVFIEDFLTPLVFRFAIGNVRAIHMGRANVDVDFSFLDNIKKFRLILQLSELIYVTRRQFDNGFMEAEEGLKLILPHSKFSEGIQRDINYEAEFTGSDGYENEVTVLSDIIIGIVKVLGDRGTYTGYNIQATAPLKDIFNIGKLILFCRGEELDAFNTLVNDAGYESEL